GLQRAVERLDRLTPSIQTLGEKLDTLLKDSLGLTGPERDLFRLRLDYVDADAVKPGFQGALIFGLSFDKQVSTTLTADLPMPADLGPLTVTAGGEVTVSAGGHFGIGIGYNFADQAPFPLVHNPATTPTTHLTLA